MKSVILPLFAALFLSLPAVAFAAPIAASGAGASVAVESFAWLAGVWHAEALGGHLENVFEPPRAGEVLCTLTVEQNGKLVRYELCAIRPLRSGGTAFQVHAFGPGMAAVAPVPPRPLVSATDSEAKFDGIDFKRTGADSMTVTVGVVTPQGPKMVLMNYTRVLTYAKP
jgi:hypothetical protein